MTDTPRAVHSHRISTDEARTPTRFPTPEVTNQVQNDYLSAGPPSPTLSTRRAPAPRPFGRCAVELRSSLDPDAHPVMPATVRAGQQHPPNALDTAPLLQG